MSINTAMNAAVSGLTAAARGVQVASTNVANAMTDGYAPRKLQLGTAVVGGQGVGVRVLGVERQVDPVLTGLVRQAGADRAGAEAGARFWADLEGAIGDPGDAFALAGRVAAFESALVSAANRPDMDQRLAAVTATAGAMLQEFHGLQRHVQDARLDADRAIAREVTELNNGLARLARLNADIVGLRSSGEPPLALMDERQTLITRLSEIVPLREYQSPEGRSILYTEGGQLLLDVTPSRIEFTPVNAMEPGMTRAGGALSTLTLNGRPIANPGEGGAFGGGRIAALFEVRDTHGVAAQAALDTMAADLIARFEAPDIDPSAPGGPALFSDAGDPLAALPAAGLAGRLTLSPLVQPDSGGHLWHLREGLGADPAGPRAPVGDAAQIQRWIEALQRGDAPAPGASAVSFGNGVAREIAFLSQTRQGFEDRQIQTATRAADLHERVLSRGVDTDAEMQRLVLIEQAYAANARVIQVADQMLRRLMEI
ncbi:flagellar hook-associated protein FlgK [Pararhodobacter sp. SW119]|uniref:flagellar hook-associated protein FlgK n=1 Tax=Pararhodobacter sp. SW119 TaxID=2780075 RepID=UPI001AE0C955|nr:flagellar hook-associated protein FlgK [Pararhodobacter sp. SW119]